MNGQVFDVPVDAEKKLAEAAQNLLDLARALTPPNLLPDTMTEKDKGFSFTASAMSLAVQSLYMADHIGSDDNRVKTKPEEMKALLHGLADGVGSCIGTSASPITWAIETVYFRQVMEGAMFRRGRDSAKRMAEK